MSEPRFSTLTPETMTTDQKRVADAIQSGPRGAGLRGPFNALLRSPELCEKVEALGAYCRFESSLPLRLREMALLIASRHFDAQYSWNAHVDKAVEAGVDREAIARLGRGEEPKFRRPPREQRAAG